MAKESNGKKARNSNSSIKQSRQDSSKNKGRGNSKKQHSNPDLRRKKG